MQVGEVIKARQITLFPFVFHYGILVQSPSTGWWYVLHNSTKDATFGNVDSKNKMTLYDEFMKTHYIIKRYGVLGSSNNSYLLERFLKVRNRPYNYLTFNCEDFVNYMIGQPKRFQSGKIQLMIAVLLVTILVAWLLRKK